MYQALVDYKEIASWISAISGLTALGGVILVWQQIKDDHERSRRQNAIEVLTRFPAIIEGLLDLKFLEEVNEADAKLLKDGNPFSIDRKHINELKNFFTLNDNQLVDTKNDKITLTKSQAEKLQHEVRKLLNRLESTLAPWRHNVASRHIIEEEFNFLLTPDRKDTLLKNVRDALGISHPLPAIEEFYTLIEEKRRKQNTLPTSGGALGSTHSGWWPFRLLGRH